MVIDQQGIHIRLVAAAGSSTAVVGTVLVEYSWDTITEVLAVKPSDEPDDMELLLIELTEEPEGEGKQKEGALTALEEGQHHVDGEHVVQIFFETDDARKVRAAVAKNIGHAEESEAEYDKMPEF
jgi:hypothetical protein